MTMNNHINLHIAWENKMDILKFSIECFIKLDSLTVFITQKIHLFSGAGGERQFFNFFLQVFYLIANTCMFGYRPEISFISETSFISGEAKIRFIELRCTSRND